ncbi:MAG: hypothetical protein KDC26_10985 [Armatimonadetes bacterium]|nr:hypothetical protein [Armatimonadota bacterium]
MRRFFAFLLFLCAGLSFGAPRLLIVQLRQPVVDEVDPNLDIDSYVASALDDEGRVEPVVWSMTDPVFRGFVDNGAIPQELLTPKEETIRGVAVRVKAELVLVLVAIKSNERVFPVATLYHVDRGRALWQHGMFDSSGKFLPSLISDDKGDQKNSEEAIKNSGSVNQNGEFVIVRVGGMPDWDSTSRTIARTWASVMGQGPLKRFPSRPRIDNPTTPNPGYRIDPNGVDINAPDSPELINQIKKLEADGRPDLAILMLRDAIDKNPFEPERRIYLSRLLSLQGLHREAAEESERAARISSDSAAVYLSAARSWLLVGESDRARVCVNEALARNANTNMAMLIMGDVRTLEGAYISAIEAYNASIMSGPRPEAILGRAIAFALAGQSEACLSDLSSLLDIQAADHYATYVSAILLVDRRTDQLAENLRELLPHANVDRISPEVQTRANGLAKSFQALATLVDHIPVPEVHGDSHKTRVLAHKLLLQSSLELLDYVRTGDDNLADEAQISLGEGLKLLPNMRARYQIERQSRRTSG